MSLKNSHCDMSVGTDLFIKSEHTSMYMLPWTSDKASLGKPLRRCKPSQF